MRGRESMAIAVQVGRVMQNQCHIIVGNYEGVTWT